MADQSVVREWLREKLAAAGRGSRIALAKYLRLSPDAITRMLNSEDGKETRAVKAHELAAMQEFFASLSGGATSSEGSQSLRDQALAIYDELPADLKRVALSQLSALASLAEQERPQAEDHQADSADQ